MARFTLVNLNTAALGDLRRLPGVGLALAQQIVAARPFRDVRDLMRVEGVGPSLYASLRLLVTLGEPREIELPEPAAANSAPADEPPTVGASAEAASAPSAGVWAPERRVPGAPRPAEAGELPPNGAPAANGPAALPGLNAESFRRSELFDRRLYNVPVKTRWRIFLALFYVVIGVGVISLVVVAYQAMAATAGPGAASTSTAAASATAAVAALPATAITAASQTLLPSDTPAPTETPAPSETAASTPTAAATGTAGQPPTAAPSATGTAAPTPTSPPGAGRFFFDERFDPLSFVWGAFEGNSLSEVRDGQLFMRAGARQLAYVFGSMVARRDFYYQATVRAAGCSPGDHFGLLTRADEAGRFYLLGVTCDGGVRVQIAEGGSFVLLVDAAGPDPAIRTGPGAENVLAVRSRLTTLEFYVNGQSLATIFDPAPAMGRFGVYARAQSDVPVTVSYDDVGAWAAEP